MVGRGKVGKAKVGKNVGDGEVISKNALNNMESGIETANKGISSTATKTKAGLVKQSSVVNVVSAGNAGTVGAEFN